MRADFGLIVERSLKTTGDTAAGFAWLRRLDGQTKAYEQNPGIISEKIARQEALVTVWDLPDVLISRERGLQVGYAFPKSGTVVIEDGIAIVRGAKHQAAARAFVDFVGSVEMQLAAAREVYRVPARLDLPADSLPDWVRDVRRRMVVADVDWTLLAGTAPSGCAGGISMCAARDGTGERLPRNRRDRQTLVSRGHGRADHARHRPRRNPRAARAVRQRQDDDAAVARGV
jgi:hypothetical protein